MLLLTIVLSIPLSHFVDTNTSFPLASNHIWAWHKEKNKKLDFFNEEEEEAPEHTHVEKWIALNLQKHNLFFEDQQVI